MKMMKTTIKGNVAISLHICILNQVDIIYFHHSSENKDEQAGDDSEDEYFYPQPAKLANREFFNVLLNCLKGHEDQRDVLLSSLHKQLVHFVRSAQDVRIAKEKTMSGIVRLS